MRTRPTHRDMISEAVETLGGKCSYTEIRDYIRGRYGAVNKSAITANIIMCTVNHPSRIHYHPNTDPRIANTMYDFLFRIARGAVELYDRERHAQWEIRRRLDGSVVVALVGGREFPPRTVKRRSRAPGGKPRWTMPRREEFLSGIEAYERREQREAVYKIAAFVVARFWGEHAVIADAVTALLVSWNRAFYRFGMFNVATLEACIADNAEQVERFRTRDISSLAYEDEAYIEGLFRKFLEALRIGLGSSRGRKSPVSAAKALHLMAPSFFPIWDSKIAVEYGCQYGSDPMAAYRAFCRVTRDVAEATRGYTGRTDKTLVKLIDEYNYSKFAKGWI